MSRAASTPSPIGPDARNHLRRHYDLLREVADRLDGPADTFALNDMRDDRDHKTPVWYALDGKLRKWVRDGVLTIDERRPKAGHRYRFERDVYDAIQAFEPKSTQLPCGHHGVRNLGARGYSCTNEWCDATCDRPAVEAAIEEDP